MIDSLFGDLAGEVSRLAAEVKRLDTGWKDANLALLKANLQLEALQGDKMIEQYIPEIVVSRWNDCVDNPSIPGFEALICLLDAFLFTLLRDDADHVLTIALSGLKTECQARIKQLMPKDNHAAYY